MRNEDNTEFVKEYSEEKLWDKFKKFAKVAGLKVVYVALLLFYTLKEEGTPIGIKATIIGALGYFISPIDIIPDIIPVVGYSDDLGTLVFALVAASFYVNSNVKSQSIEKLKLWFGEVDENDLEDINKYIKN